MTQVDTKNMSNYKGSDSNTVDMTAKPSADRADTIDLRKYNNYLRVIAGAQNDIIYGSNKHFNLLIGDISWFKEDGTPYSSTAYKENYTGNDKIHGGASADYILASAGDDEIWGGKGVNILAFRSGDGNDTVYSSGGSDYLYFYNTALGKLKYERINNDLIIDYSDYTDDGSEVVIDAPSKVILSEYYKYEKKFSTKGIIDCSADYSKFKDLFSSIKTEKEFIAEYKKTIPQMASSLWDIASTIAINVTLNKKTKFKGLAQDETVTLSSFGDTVDTKAGSDTIIAGTGNDIITGGAGDDTFIFSSGFSSGIITDAQYGDKVKFQDVSYSELKFEKISNNLIITHTKNENDKLTLQNYFKFKAPIETLVTKDTVTDEDGNETQKEVEHLFSTTPLVVKGSGKLEGNNGDNIITGSSKNDSITPYKGEDTINAGKGKNTIYLYEGDGANTLISGGGVDTLVFDSNLSLIFSQNGNDVTISYKDGSITLKDYRNGGHSAKYVKQGKKTTPLSDFLSDKFGTSGKDSFTSYLKNGTIALKGGSDTVTFKNDGTRTAPNEVLITSSADLDKKGNATNTDTLIFKEYSMTANTLAFGWGSEDSVINSEDSGELPYKNVYIGTLDYSNSGYLASFVICKDYLSSNAPKLVVQDKYRKYHVLSFSGSVTKDYNDVLSNLLKNKHYISYINSSSNDSNKISLSNGYNVLFSAGAKQNEFTYNGGFAGLTTVSESNDIYNINSFTNKTWVSIIDAGGQDSINIKANSSSMRLFFNVIKGSDELSGSLSIMHKNNLTAAKTKTAYFQDIQKEPSTQGVTVVVPSSIEKYSTNDHDNLNMSAWINAVRQNVASWLNAHADYASTLDVYTKNNPIDIKTLVACYNVDYNSVVQ